MCWTEGIEGGTEGFWCWTEGFRVWSLCGTHVLNWGGLCGTEVYSYFCVFRQKNLFHLKISQAVSAELPTLKKTLLKILACGNNLHEKACKSVRKSEPAWQPDGGRWPQDANFRERKNELNLSHQNFTWDLMLYIKYILSCKK